MTKIKILLSLVLLSVLFSQCATDPVQKDLLNYINTELPKVSALETKAIDAYESVVEKNYTTDSAMYYKIKEVVLPAYTEFTTNLQAIVPATNEIKTVHAEYVKASQNQLEAFKLILDAIEKQDANEIQQANADLTNAVNLIGLWKKDIDTLCVKHGVTLTK